MRNALLIIVYITIKVAIYQSCIAKISFALKCEIKSNKKNFLMKNTKRKLNALIHAKECNII